MSVLMGVQFVGAMLVLAAFALVRFKVLPEDSRINLLLNFFGSLVLAILAIVERQWGFLFLEGIWALVSLIGLLSGKRVSPAH